jgi:hypothetical protein
VRELRDASLIVADKGDGRLLRVWLDARSPRTIGRAGEGPGEYRGVSAVLPLGSDSSLFVDGFHFRWSIYAGDRFIRSYSEAREINRLLGASLAGTDRFGHVLGVRALAKRGKSSLRTHADSLVLILADIATGISDTVARLRGRGGHMVQVRPRGSAMSWLINANPLAAEDEAHLTHDGWIAIAYAEPYRVDWRDPVGRWTRGSPLPYVRVVTSEREKCAAISRVYSMRACEPSDIPDWPATLPPFVRPEGRSHRSVLLSDNLNRLFVARLGAADAAHNRYDVLDRSAKLIGVLTLPLNEHVLGFGAQSIYVVATNDDGLQAIRRHPWR